MPLEVNNQVGEQLLADGVSGVPRLGRQADQIGSDLHGPMYETNLRAHLFGGGMALTAISNVTYTTGTLGATVTPIIGVYNPANSPVSLAILRAYLNVILTASTNTGGGGFVWATSIGNLAISTGTRGLSMKTLVLGGGFGLDMTNVAPTGLTNNLVARRASGLGGGSSGNFSFVGTAVGQATTNAAFIENIDGGIIVPPGGILALLANTTPVAHSASSGIVWEEIPV